MKIRMILTRKERRKQMRQNEINDNDTNGKLKEPVNGLAVKKKK